MRQIHTELEAYARAHGGRYPDRLADLLLVPGAEITAETFICPSSSDERARGDTPEAVAAGLSEPGRLSYVYLGGAVGAEVEKAAIVLYEPLENHGHGLHVCRVDGSAEFVDKREVPSALSELSAGRNPPRRLTR